MNTIPADTSVIASLSLVEAREQLALLEKEVEIARVALAQAELDRDAVKAHIARLEAAQNAR